jgi:hypothetical protein
VRELGQQAALPAIGFLSPFALATELQRGNHVWAPWCPDRPSLVELTRGRGVRKDIVQGMARQEGT